MCEMPFQKAEMIGLLLLAVSIAGCITSQSQQCLRKAEALSSGKSLKTMDTIDILNCRSTLEDNIEKLFFETGDKSVREYALYCMLLIGDSRAKEFLKTIAQVGNNLDAQEYTCVLMAAGNDPEDRKYLEEDMQKEYEYPASVPTTSAPLSLGIMRNRESIKSLRNCIDKHGNRIMGQNARSALRWIESQPPEIIIALKNPKEQQLISAILRNGIPRIDSDIALYENRKERKWIYSKNEWKCAAISHEEERPYPSIDFNVLVSLDNKKAVVDVGLNFAPLNGSGYQYLLENENNQWKVVGILYSWTS
jgi:hypothetical protein